jgi:hypothetical protein
MGWQLYSASRVNLLVPSSSHLRLFDSVRPTVALQPESSTCMLQLCENGGIARLVMWISKGTIRATGDTRL